VADRIRGEGNIERLVARGLVLGERTHLARPIYLDGVCPWLITIEDDVTFGEGVFIITHDTSLAQYTALTRFARVNVGKRAFIGSGAILLPGTTIGEDSVVAAGSVVHGKFPAGALIAGNPAEVAAKAKAIAAFNRKSAAESPSWPEKSPGMTEEELRRRQREALADGASAYVAASAGPGSPFELKQQRS
jgi:maltose O-acetyltransferase